jgi:hypothetical protein
VKEPSEALAAAREAAARSPDANGLDAGGEWHLKDPAASARRLAQWAIIEPEEAEIYSTRRLGKPITWFKRLLVRMLRQYIGQISAQQSRFNAQIAAHVMRLEERVGALEEAARERDADEQSPR